MVPFVYPFLLLAGAGLILSAISHVCGLMGVPGPLGDRVWFLHMGIFVVWIPAVLAALRLTGKVPRKDFWKAALRGCPPWMRYGAFGLFCYALLSFAFFMLTSGTARNSNGPMPWAVVRAFSGHWMIFYGAAFAILYSFVRCGDANRIGPRGSSNGESRGS